MAYEFITAERTGAVMKITLNRPSVLNSFNAQMARELRAALDAVRLEKSIRAVLLTGAGRAFCAGQDLSEVPATADGRKAFDLATTVRVTYNPVIRTIRKLERPVVCAVNGVAAGAGANLVLACDIVIAGDKASFIQSFSKVGLIPDSGGTFFLPRIIGLPRATALMMIGERIDAKRAYEMGMIYKVCAADALEQEAMTLASELAAMPTRGLGLTKRALNASFSNTLDAQLDLEAELQGEAGNTPDFVEGVRAFLEKRKPNFTGEYKTPIPPAREPGR
ncbi:MAG TPA: 2-(1,2-epoxy-1,2-dihydrophenyl)acetyl-CoA isomerase PaaG [Gemmatimonadaceae bacterium]